jgi:hypothetical protein
MAYTKVWNPKILVVYPSLENLKHNQRITTGSHKEYFKLVAQFIKVLFKASRPIKQVVASHSLFQSSIIVRQYRWRKTTAMFPLGFSTHLDNSTILYEPLHWSKKFVPSLMLPIHHHDIREHFIFRKKKVGFNCFLATISSFYFFKWT